MQNPRLLSHNVGYYFVDGHGETDHYYTRTWSTTPEEAREWEGRVPRKRWLPGKMPFPHFPIRYEVVPSAAKSEEEEETRREAVILPLNASSTTDASGTRKQELGQTHGQCENHEGAVSVDTDINAETSQRSQHIAKEIVAEGDLATAWGTTQVTRKRKKEVKPAEMPMTASLTSGKDRRTQAKRRKLDKSALIEKPATGVQLEPAYFAHIRMDKKQRMREKRKNLDGKIIHRHAICEDTRMTVIGNSMCSPKI